MDLTAPPGYELLERDIFELCSPIQHRAGFIHETWPFCLAFFPALKILLYLPRYSHPSSHLVQFFRACFRHQHSAADIYQMSPETGVTLELENHAGL